MDINIHVEYIIYVYQRNEYECLEVQFHICTI